MPRHLIDTGNQTLSGDLTITGVLNALSANIRVLDIQVYELSGFEVTGNVKIDGNTTVNGTLSATTANFSTISAASYLGLPTIADIDNYLPLSGGNLTGALSSNSIIYSNTGNSDQWSNVYTAYNSTSAANASVNSTVIGLSSGWQTAYNSLSTLASLSSLSLYLPLSGGSLTGALSSNSSATFNTISAGNIKTVNSNSLFGYGNVYIPNLVWRGAYDNSASYAINDGVFYNGSSYICVTAGTGNLPTNITFWGLLASQGLQGTTGASGAFSVPFTNVTSVTATHNFSAYPVIQLIDNGSPPAVLVPSSITHPNTNSSVITFALSTTGTVLCTLGGSSVTGYLPLTGGTMTGGISSNSDATFSNILITSIPSTVDYDALLVLGSSLRSVYMSVQNASPGLSASTDISIYNVASQYLDMGIASSTYNGNTYSPKFNIINAGDSYLYSIASDLMIGTALSSNNDTNDIVLFTGGTLSGSSAVGGNERMRITKAGNVGIGTLLPNQVLTVVGNISSNSIIYSNNGNSDQWNGTYTAYNSTSAANASVNSTVINLSSGWQTSYNNLSTLASLSSLALYLPLSGGNLTGTLSSNSSATFQTISAANYLGLPSNTYVIAGYKAVSTAYTVLSSDYTVNCTANTFTIQLPTAVNKSGQIFNIKNSGTGVITVSGFGSQTIDDANTVVIGTKYNSMTIQSTNANWIII